MKTSLGIWALVFGAIFINLSWILGGAADGGWFMYSPNSSVPYSPTNGIDFWALGRLLSRVPLYTAAETVMPAIVVED